MFRVQSLLIGILEGYSFLQLAMLRGGGGNMVTHSLARYAKNIIDEMYWLKDSLPPVVDALYQDLLHLNE